MIFELRQYTSVPVRRDKWVKCMEEEIIPFQVKMGMVILGSFVGEEDESVYVWIPPVRERAGAQAPLRFSSTRATTGKNEISPRVPTLIDRRADQGHPPAGDAALGHQ